MLLFHITTGTNHVMTLTNEENKQDAVKIGVQTCMEQRNQIINYIKLLFDIFAKSKLNVSFMKSERILV